MKTATFFRTPTGTFDRWAEAAAECDRFDFDPGLCMMLIDVEDNGRATERPVGEWAVDGLDHDQGGKDVTLPGRETYDDALRCADLLRQCGYRTRIRPVVG